METTTVQLIALSSFNYDTLINETNVLNKYNEYLSENKKYFLLPQGRLVIVPINEYLENSNKGLLFSNKLVNFGNDYCRSFDFSIKQNTELLNFIKTNNQYKVLLVWELNDLTNKEVNLLNELLPFFQLVNNYRTEYKINDDSILPEIVVESAITDYFDDMDYIIENFESFENFEACRYKYLQNIIREIFNDKVHNINELYNNKHISEDECIYLTDKNNSRIEPNIKYYNGKQIGMKTILGILNSILLPIFNKQKNNNFNYPEIDESRETESDYKNMDSIEKYY